MTIKQKAEMLQQQFLTAWDHYSKIEAQHAKGNGLKELLSTPALKTAYQQWQNAVSDYYDFAKSIENRDINDEYRG